MPVNLIDPSTGAVHVVPDEQVDGALRLGWTPESDAGAAARTTAAQIHEDYSGPLDKAKAFVGSALSAATLGGSDVLQRIGSSGDAIADERRIREENQPYTTAGAILGSVGPALVAPESLLGRTPAGLSARLGARIAHVGEDASLLTRVARGAAGAATDATLQGIGQNVGDLALSDDPITMEHLAGALTTNLHSNALISGVLGGGLSTLEHGLIRGGRKLAAAREADAAAAKGIRDPADPFAPGGPKQPAPRDPADPFAPPSGGAVTDDIPALDMAAAREAEKAEKARIVAEDVTPQRQALVRDIADFRQWHGEARPWDALATGNKEAAEAAKKLAKSTERAAAKAERELARLEAITPAVAEDATVAGKASALVGESPELVAAREAAAAARRSATDAALEYDVQASRLRDRAPSWVREGGKQYIEADKSIRKGLNNMERLGEASPGGQAARGAMRDALQRQRQILTEMEAKTPELEQLHALDKTTRRADALDQVPEALKRNRALQDRLDALDAPPMSPRLEALQNHMTDLKLPKPPATMGQKLKAAGAYAAVSALGHAILPGFADFAVAPLGAMAAAKVLGEKSGVAMREAVAASRARTEKAVNFFLTGTRAAKRAAPKAIPLASKVLASVRFGPPAPTDESPSKPAKAPRLEDLYRARVNEIAAAVMQTPDGPKVRPHVRDRIGAALEPLAHAAPHVADKMESAAVAKLEFLAAKAPHDTVIGMTRIPPSEMAMRAWARYIDAANNPAGIEERLAAGTVTPEDREVMRTLYPARMAEIVRMTVENMGTLRGSLDYHARLSLGLFTGAAVDASTDPRILGQLQAMHANEPNTEGGTQAPRPRPAFGSVSKNLTEPTPAQQRAG